MGEVGPESDRKQVQKDPAIGPQGDRSAVHGDIAHTFEVDHHLADVLDRIVPSGAFHWEILLEADHEGLRERLADHLFVEGWGS